MRVVVAERLVNGDITRLFQLLELYADVSRSGVGLLLHGVEIQLALFD